jgi:hypothetical protein
MPNSAFKKMTAGLLLAAFTSACAPAASPTPTITPTETETATPTASNTPTRTPTATKTPTPRPTLTLVPSNTPTRRPPTNTPQGPTADPNQPTAEVTNTPEGGQVTEEPTTEPAQGDNYAPLVAQVWQLDTNPISKSSTDACGGEMAVDFYGLVAVRPDGDNLIWHRQDGNDYTLVKVSLNQYSGGGGSSVPDFNLSIYVTFTSATTLVANHTLTSISNPDCKHTYKYNGKFNWNS